jgi:hypothetical protein
MQAEKKVKDASIHLYLQAFNITGNKTESLDNMLTDMLKSRMPLGGLQLFGIEQVETDNMSTCEYRTFSKPIQNPQRLKAYCHACGHRLKYQRRRC